MTQDQLEGQEVVLIDGRVGTVMYSHHPAVVSGGFVLVKTPWAVVAVRPEMIDEESVDA